MQAKYADLLPADTCKWLQIDVRDMSCSISSESVDVAIDKGTLDAMLHGSLWDPPDEVRENVGRYVDEVCDARWTCAFFECLGVELRKVDLHFANTHAPTNA